LQARTVELQDLAVSLEAQRRDSETERDRLEAALRGTEDARIVINEAGHILMVNAGYVERFGGSLAPLDAEDESGHRLPPEMAPQQRAARGESFVMPLIIRDREGAPHRFEVTGEPIRSGEPRGGIITLREFAASGVSRR
jgi:PAS domain-containing protein